MIARASSMVQNNVDAYAAITAATRKDVAGLSTCRSRHLHGNEEGDSVEQLPRVANKKCRRREGPCVQAPDALEATNDPVLRAQRGEATSNV
eukprot:scaffold13607_cov35-Tisochrysis_lutea.AAC.5